MRDGVERLRALLVAAAAADARASGVPPAPARVVAVIGTGPDLGSVARAGLGGTEVILVGSCDSFLILDLATQRFRPAFKTADFGALVPAANWRRYFKLSLDPYAGVFTIALNNDRSELFRSWVHVDPCRRCGSDDPDAR